MDSGSALAEPSNRVRINPRRSPYAEGCQRCQRCHYSIGSDGTLGILGTLLYGCGSESKANLGEWRKRRTRRLVRERRRTRPIHSNMTPFEGGSTTVDSPGGAGGPISEGTFGRGPGRRGLRSLNRPGGRSIHSSSRVKSLSSTSRQESGIDSSMTRQSGLTSRCDGRPRPRSSRGRPGASGIFSNRSDRRS